MTSHDVVQHARRILREKRIGHTGTLDPLATGVLVLCIGKATRIAQYLEAGEKEYRAIMRLGITTDSLDAEGRILEIRPYTAPDHAQLYAVMQQFIGTIMQRPPAYSAVKIAGVPSYKLARQGKSRPHEPRPVTIHSIEVTAYEDPYVSITVKCAKGVYIRSLCADIGDLLCSGAHVTKLQRIRSGRFTLEGAVTLETLAGMAQSGSVAQAVMSVDEALADFPVLRITETETARVIHGNKIPCSDTTVRSGSGLVRLHSPAGTFLALARLNTGVIRPELVFHARP